MKSCLVLIIVLLTSLYGAPQAVAGNHGCTQVYGGTNWSSGCLSGSRFSPDTVQYIGCGMNSSAYARCYSTDSAGTYRSCYTTDTNMVSQLHGMSDYSYIYFSYDTAGKCTSLYVQSASFQIP